MKVINLTPLAIVWRGPEGDVSYAPSGTVARVATRPGYAIAPSCSCGCGEEHGYDSLGCQCPRLAWPAFTSPTMGGVEGLPPPVAGVVYLVSAMVAGALAGAGRQDVFSPGTGPGDSPIRNGAGQIEAVTRFIRAPQ